MKLDEYELVLLLHIISFIEKGNEFPTPVELSSSMTITASDCSNRLRKLIQKGLIEINDGFTSDGIRFEKYSLDPLWEKLIDQFLLQEKRKKRSESMNKKQPIYIHVLNRNLADPCRHLKVKLFLCGWMKIIMMPILLNQH